VSSPLVVSYGCAVRLLGTVAADLRERVHLISGAWCWQYVRCSIVMCGWLYSLGGPLASKVVCSLFAYLITPIHLSKLQIRKNCILQSLRIYSSVFGLIVGVYSRNMYLIYT
jgi:hypothetical protein